MVIDIKMCRFDNVPWGFRLVGGADFEYPPTVVKVAEGSLAEEAGLRVGDVIVRLNDTPTSPLAHDELNKIITHCGNVFYFGVYREEPEEPETGPKHFPLIGVERPTTSESFLDMSSSCKSPNSGEDEYLRDMSDRPCSVLSENTEIKMVEEEIAAVLSGESEVLKEHNIMGIFPKPGVCMSSDVLRTLNEEAIKTKAEKDKENKKWTTFLQKPNRPIPKSKVQIEAERRAENAYRVKIIKSAPRTPSRSVSPMPPPVPEIRAKEDKKDEEKSQPSKEHEIPTDEAPTPTDNEVPNLEETPIVVVTAAEVEAEAAAAADQRESTSEDGEEKIDCEKEARPETKETESENVQVDSKNNNDNNSDNSNNSNNIGTSQVNERQVERTAQARQVDRSAEELALEGQLASVQKQLAALSSLPSTIQATLDAVTRQLADLLPTLKLQQVQPRDISLEQIDENAAEANVEDGATNKYRDRDHVDDADADIDDDDNKMERNREQEQSANEDKQRTTLTEQTQQREQQDPIKLMESAQSREDTREMEEEQSLKKQKQNDVIEELEEHLERKNNPKRSKRAFGPLTPSSERPLVLPGGRRWYRPKDAYNDEFIAETLSAQAELISGTTLGCTFESPLLGYDPRVNFMKYQKPERKIDLNRSEVYKVIHHLDRQPVRGIEVRPPIVAAEVDVRKAVSS